MTNFLNAAVNRAIREICTIGVPNCWRPAPHRLVGRARLVLTGLVTVTTPVLAQPRIIVEKNIPARMRDGVILRADVYRPDTADRLPVLLQRTPYSKNPGREDNLFRRLSARGYIVVVQDTRGRYTSDGVAKPHDEAEDGYDTIEWAAALPSSNGRVGTFG